METDKEKLTLKELATAFSNNHKVFYFDDERELSQICRIVELREEEMTISNGEYQYDVSFDDVKIICLSLSDLTKEITHNGETFVPIEYNAFKHSKNDIIEFQNKFIHYKGMKYGIIERLLEWHFDVFSLIERGLAININDLPNE